MQVEEYGYIRITVDEKRPGLTFKTGELYSYNKKYIEESGLLGYQVQLRTHKARVWVFDDHCEKLTKEELISELSPF